MEFSLHEYWSAPLVYAILLLAFFINDSVTRRKTAVEQSSRLMTLWVIFFCMQDVFWGLCDEGIINNDKIFFASSFVFHLSTVVTTYFWLRFVLSYLHIKPRRQRVYLLIDGAVILFQVTLLAINFFKPIVFRIVDGEYVTYAWRPVSFYNQYIVYVISVIICLLYITGILRRKEQEHQSSYFPVFAASMAPTLLGVLQLMFPHDAFYSLGYFLACFLIHIFIVAKDQANASNAGIFHSISKTYYSMHLVDLEKDKATIYVEPPILTGLIGKIKSAQQMLNSVIVGTSNEEYRKLLLEFVDLSTLSERMADKNLISCEFIGRNFGWTRISFVSVEKEDGIQKQVIVFTQIIDDSKRHEIDLIFKSNNDELTSLYNRYAYENELNKIQEENLEDSLVVIAMDINGLKQINDNHGHAAGDELIIGAADCMKQCLSSYGNVFRTGGDEFLALVHASKDQLDCILRDFDETVLAWRGKKVDSLSVSLGCVTRDEVKNGNIHEMVKLADERMYKNKAEYYQKKGIDRRGQRDAHIALCSLYTKILKINLTTDSFQILNMEVNEKTYEKGYSESISQWLHSFGKAGLVHPDDLTEYLKKTSVDYITNYFASNKTSLHLFYRRKIDLSFKQVMMEIVPANDYTPENQSFYLYVKNIDN